MMMIQCLDGLHSIGTYCSCFLKNFHVLLAEEPSPSSADLLCKDQDLHNPILWLNFSIVSLGIISGKYFHEKSFQQIILKFIPFIYSFG